MPSLNEAARKLTEADRANSLEGKFEDLEGLSTDATVKEDFFSKNISEKQPDAVAGVDGGIKRKRYYSGDAVIVRAVAAEFEFENRKLKETNYIPRKSPEPEYHVMDSSDNESLQKNSEILRLKQEISTALDALESAGFVLMDGSIVPSYGGSTEVLEKYESLFNEAEKGSVAGVVEDSFGLKLAELLEDKTGIEIGEIRDTHLMDQILNSGQRSFVRRYSSSPVEHPVLRNLDNEYVNTLYTFYVKLSEKDIPLRVDYYGDVKDADIIAGKLMFLRSSASYTVPSVILEADKRAKIPEKYIKRLEKKFSPCEIRRERRSF